VTVYVEGGPSYAHEVSDYPGFPTHPFTWKQVSAKFDELTKGCADQGLRDEIKSAVGSLERIRVSDLMQLLARVNARGT
jgi:2-methylcitrate dehydratase